ncbi:toxin-like protein 14 [Limulus polyphemus]|uniref:Toxin-like protein 14 n=1 Tax=Limulus polyphemus TaxID=6850 RepID=A0ABM1SJB3_LIMPO|nr:toxin-like protein 14 [Limulus polyphemus]
MKFLTLTLITLCFITFSAAYLFREIVEKKNGGCYLPDFGQIENKGVVYNDEKCEIRVCDADGDEAFINGAGCGVIGIDDPNCKLVPGEGHYPSCCPAPICKKPDNK